MENQCSRTDSELLEDFKRTGGEGFFAEIVKRHLRTVFGVAFRRTGDRRLSEEITQNVFTVLARKATGLESGVILGGWLHRAAMIETSLALRRESGRRKIMQTYSETCAGDSLGRDPLSDVLPEVDEVIEQLPRVDRDVILLRFYENLAFREVGARIGKTEEAARKQTTRALEKISDLLRRRGVVAPASVLAIGLASAVNHATPSVASGSVAASSLGAASAVPIPILIAHGVLGMSTGKLVIGTAGLCLALLSIPLAIQNHANSILQREILALRAAPQSAPATAKPSPRAESTSSATTLSSTTTASVFQRAQAILSGRKLLLPREYDRVLNVLRELPAQEITTAAVALESINDTDTRRWLGEALVEIWGEHDPSGAIAWATTNLPPEAQRRRLPGLIANWSEQDASAAASWLRQFVDSRNANLSLRPGPEINTYESLAKTGARDRDAEMRFQEAMFENLGMGSGSRDLPAALQLGASFRNRADKVAFFDGLVNNVANVETCRELAEFMTGEGERALGLHPQEPQNPRTLLFSKWARYDAPSAAEYVQNLANPDLKPVLSAVVAREWVQVDPPAAAEWWIAQTPSEQLGDTYEQVARLWSALDARAAGEWLNTQPDGPARDRAVLAFVGEIALSQPDLAMEWAESISDREKRQEWVNNVSHIRASTHRRK